MRKMRYLLSLLGSMAMGASASAACPGAPYFSCIDSDNSGNSGFGTGTLQSLTTGYNNTAVGIAALASNTKGNHNTSSGFYALYANTTGNLNTATGSYALNSNTVGGRNTGIGVNALKANTTGHDNIAVGVNAGLDLTTGSDNIDIGNLGVAGETKIIRIGKQGTQLKTFIAGIRGATVSGAAVVVSSTGQLGVQTSLRRYKDDIHPLGDASVAQVAP